MASINGEFLVIKFSLDITIAFDILLVVGIFIKLLREINGYVAILQVYEARVLTTSSQPKDLIR
jgi:hypothetical protein